MASLMTRTCEGWLQLRPSDAGFIKKKITRRYAVLSPWKLELFKKESDELPVRQFHISEIARCPKEQEVSGGHHLRCT